MIIANLSNLSWAPGRGRRNQDLFCHLLGDSDVFEEGFFLQPPVVRSARPFDFFPTPELEVVSAAKVSGRPVTILQPIFSLPAGFANSMAMKRSIGTLAQRFVREHFRNRPFLFWINSVAHFQGSLAEALLPSAQIRVFDGTEGLLMLERNFEKKAAAIEHDPARMKQKYGILESCDAVVCGNERALERISHSTKFLFPACTDFERFQKRESAYRKGNLFPKPEGGIYIGFTGVISQDRIDIDLLHSLFTRFPFYQFIFIGTTNRPALLARMKDYPNFHYLPEPAEAELPGIFHQLDVAIVPHLDNEYTRSNDTARVLDYMACGIPVVTTASWDAERYGRALYAPRSAWEFGNLLERLAGKGLVHDPAAGFEIARRQAWPARIPELVEWLFETQSGPVKMIAAS